MTGFPLKIVTPEGLVYDGSAEEVVVRTISGDMAILPRHINCVAPLGMGRATVVTGGERRYAACSGGLISVANGNVTLISNTFRWEKSLRF